MGVLFICATPSPAEVGPRVAENFFARELDYEDGSRPYVIYPEVISWYGSLEVARLTRQAALQEKFVRKFDKFLTPDGAKHISPADHVDYHVFGAVPLEISLLTKDKKYLEQAKHEFEIGQKLNHPHILKVLAYEEVKAWFFGKVVKVLIWILIAVVLVGGVYAVARLLIE